MATIGGGFTRGGNSMFGGVGDNKSETQNNLFHMLPYLLKREKLFNDMEGRYRKVDYSTPLPNTGIDALYANYNYLMGHPKSLKLVPYPIQIYPDTSYEGGRDPTLLKAVGDRYVDVAGTYYTKKDIKNYPSVNSALAGNHKVRAKVF